MDGPASTGWIRNALRAAVVAACATALAAATAPPSAAAKPHSAAAKPHSAAAKPHRLRLRPLQPPASGPLFPLRAADRIRARPLRVRAARRAQAHASRAVFRTGDGVSIPVQVSSAYVPNASVEQGYVNLLGGLVHGSELSKLSVYIATPAQIQRTFCGSGALACYVGDEERMYVPGVTEHSNPSVQFLIAHEYGHHIELNRSDRPWSAFDMGAKRWASYENVCALEHRRRVGTSYFNDPSEAFAESYADMQYPGVDFIYTDLLAPDQGAFRAIREDVLDPWDGPRTVTLHGSGSRSFRLATPLDGDATFDLTADPGSAYRLRVLARAHALRRRHSSRAARAAGSYLICGERSLTVRVKLVSGSGAFTLAVTLP